MRIDSYLKNLPWSRAIFPELVGELALASAMALLGTLLSDFSDGKCSSSFSVCFVTLASPFRSQIIALDVIVRDSGKLEHLGSGRKFSELFLSYHKEFLGKILPTRFVTTLTTRQTRFQGVSSPAVFSLGERLMGWTSLFDPSRSNLQDFSLKGCSWLT